MYHGVIGKGQNETNTSKCNENMLCLMCKDMHLKKKCKGMVSLIFPSVNICDLRVGFA